MVRCSPFSPRGGLTCKRPVCAALRLVTGKPRSRARLCYLDSFSFHAWEDSSCLERPVHGLCRSVRADGAGASVLTGSPRRRRRSCTEHPAGMLLVGGRERQRSRSPVRCRRRAHLRQEGFPGHRLRRKDSLRSRRLPDGPTLARPAGDTTDTLIPTTTSAASTTCGHRSAPLQSIFSIPDRPPPP